jgi:hypothetical protein
VVLTELINYFNDREIKGEGILAVPRTFELARQMLSHLIHDPALLL